jgi:hypothetical protein
VALGAEVVVVKNSDDIDRLLATKKTREGGRVGQRGARAINYTITTEGLIEMADDIIDVVVVKGRRDLAEGAAYKAARLAERDNVKAILRNTPNPTGLVLRALLDMIDEDEDDLSRVEDLTDVAWALRTLILTILSNGPTDERERAQLLNALGDHNNRNADTPIEELRERARLLDTINRD